MVVTTIGSNGLRGEFSFVFQSAKSQRTYLFRVKYVVCPPTKVALYLTELFSSTVSLSFPSLAAKNTYEELDINIVCELIFFERQNHNESEVFMYSFRR